MNNAEIKNGQVVFVAGHLFMSFDKKKKKIK